MKIRSFTVLPDTPEPLNSLNKLAYNMSFAWTPEFLELFHELDPACWEESGRNPVRMLCLISQERLDEAATDEVYLAKLSAVYADFRDYMDRETWYDKKYGKAEKVDIAYFCAEFGIHECLHIYS